ncbi:MAG: PQQ-binding-like beta-propeller repeat protein, partial [Verrucomicrobiota bacterium]
MSANAPVKRLWFPLGVILLFSAFVAWTYVTENTMRVAFLFMAVVLGGLIVGLWWGFGSGAFRWKSLVGGILGLVALGFLGRATLRFDGSADGATPLKFVWKWTPTAEEGLGVPEVAPSSPDSFGLVAALEGAAPFLGFLGEQRDGLVPDIGLDPDWEASPPEEMWRIRVGVGWSSFAVAQNRAVTQEQRGEKELVTCYDLASGRFLWAHEDETRFYEAMGGPGPRATPTISPEDGTVFAVGASGILNALDLGTGQLKWTATVLADETKNIEWGVSSSPLLAGDLVITAAGTAKEGETSPVVFA